MDIDILKDAITMVIDGVPVSLCWKMILLRTEGSVLESQKIKALHVYINELDVLTSLS